MKRLPKVSMNSGAIYSRWNSQAGRVNTRISAIRHAIHARKAAWNFRYLAWILSGSARIAGYVRVGEMLIHMVKDEGAGHKPLSLRQRHVQSWLAFAKNSFFSQLSGTKLRQVEHSRILATLFLSILSNITFINVSSIGPLAQWLEHPTHNRLVPQGKSVNVF